MELDPPRGIAISDASIALHVSEEHLHKFFDDPIVLFHPGRGGEDAEAVPMTYLDSMKFLIEFLSEHPELVCPADQERPEANPKRPNYCFDVNPRVFLHAPWWEGGFVPRKNGDV